MALGCEPLRRSIPLAFLQYPIAVDASDEARMPMTVAEALLPFGWLRLGGALLLAAGPGLALSLLILPHEKRDATMRAALALAMSMAFWPVLFTWLEPMPLRLTPTSALIIAALGWALAAVLWYVQRRSPAPAARDEAPSLWPRLLLWLIVLAAALLGMRAIGGFVAGMGSDSYHHTLIAQLFADGGRIPANYEPYAPLATFRYHFGFHALAAVLTWFSGIELRLLVPILAEVLVGLAPLTVAYMVEAIGGDRRASLIAALLTAFISPFPSLMVLYGRFTQLADLVMLPVFMGLVWRAAWPKEDAEQRAWPRVIALAVLAAGLGLTHYRVAIVAGYGAIVFAAVNLVGSSERRAALGRMVRTLVPALVGALLLIAPWIWHVASTWNVGFPIVLGGGSRRAFYDLSRLGSDIILQPTNWVLLAVSLIGLWGGWRSHRRTAVISLATWIVALVVFSTEPFAKTRLDAVSAAICQYVPVAAVAGIGLAALVDWLAARRGAWRWVMAVALVAASSVGAYSMARSIAPRWVYLNSDDIGAMRWIAQATPPEAKFAVTTYNFLFAPRFVIGIDAGYWIPLLAHRNTMTVPMTYPEERATRPDLADSLVNLHALGGHLATDEAVAFLRAQGVNYVFNGSNGWLINTAELDASPHYDLVYNEGRVAVYKLLGPAEPG
ncbi:MAG: hypothetical protein A2Z30_07710 [Chloroflexi bacterium RBG_16_64_43]|nr:MAG: hypothetical protein A2Z30_07710 [Chloroflexi bacterium RBG_16_64_43]